MVPRNRYLLGFCVEHSLDSARFALLLTCLLTYSCLMWRWAMSDERVYNMRAAWWVNCCELCWIIKSVNVQFVVFVFVFAVQQKRKCVLLTYSAGFFRLQILKPVRVAFPATWRVKTQYFIIFLFLISTHFMILALLCFCSLSLSYWYYGGPQ